MKQAIIVAIDTKAGYAKDHKIPWHYSEDFKWFKKQTMGHICVMGRNTYEEINEKIGEKGKESVLPGRRCFVVSSTLTELPNATVIKKYEDIFIGQFSDAEYDNPELTIFTLGGERLFEKNISAVDTVYTTIINKDHECDQFFDVKSLEKLFMPSQTFALDSNDDLRFVIWKRRPTNAIGFN